MSIQFQSTIRKMARQVLSAALHRRHPSAVLDLFILSRNLASKLRRGSKKTTSWICSRRSSKRCRKSSRKTAIACCRRRLETGHKSWRTSVPLQRTRSRGRQSCLPLWSRAQASQTRDCISHTEIQIWAQPPLKNHQMVRCYRNRCIISSCKRNPAGGLSHRSVWYTSKRYSCAGRAPKRRKIVGIGIAIADHN